MTMTPSRVRIGLWGASQSGKTTFLAVLRQAAPRSEETPNWKVDDIDERSISFLNDATRRGKPLILGQVKPINVLEPLLWLEKRFRSTPEARQPTEPLYRMPRTARPTGREQ